MSVFEIGMLACFGFSWPFSIAKSLRTREVKGKSPLFMWIVILGYLFGIAHKLVYDMNWVMWLYVADLALVATDLFLYYRYSSRRQGNDTREAGRLHIERRQGNPRRRCR